MTYLSKHPISVTDKDTQRHDNSQAPLRILCCIIFTDSSHLKTAKSMCVCVLLLVEEDTKGQLLVSLGERARRESSWYITVRLATVWDWVAERPSSFMGITDSAQVIPTWVMLSQRERERREEKEWDCFCHKKRCWRHLLHWDGRPNCLKRK